MKTSVSRIWVLWGVLLVAGCAGQNFVKMTGNQLVLGETTFDQIKRQQGDPYREGVVTKNGRQLKTASYAYSSAGGQADGAGVTPARSQGFYFLDGVLVGYEFTSSYLADSTGFDGRKVAQIRKGVSTRSDVVRLFGEPGGEYIYPMIEDKGHTAINYVHHQTKGTAFNLKFYQQVLVVTLDGRGVVQDVEYSESGQE